MDLNTLGIIASIAVGAVTVLGATVAAIAKMYSIGSRQAKLEVKVDTMWDFLMKRALSEAVSKNIASMNSPAVVSDEAKGWFAALADALKEFYRTNLVNRPDTDAMLEIEKHFSDRILKEVCIPRGLHAGECLLIALSVARDGSIKV